MSKIFQVRITGSDSIIQGATLVSSTSVYADTAAEAQILGAKELNVPRERVTVQEIPNVSNPTDQELFDRFKDRGY